MTPSNDDETRPVDRPADDETRRLDRESDDETIRRDPSTGDDETVITDGARGESASKGRSIGRYRLLSELGQGGQGAVYLAEDERLRRKVALKVLFGGSVHSTEARLRFEREAEATGRLNHPGIAKIYEMDEAEGVPFIAMELVEGESLAERLKEAAGSSAKTEAPSSLFLDLEAEQSAGSSRATRGSSTRSGAATGDRELGAAARFIESAARAVHAAHEAGLVHRDIKPANIMVRPDGSPCILDFGLAHDEDSVGVTLTGSRDRFGTPAYMAPEQVRGRTREIDARTDVWALGATLYECCTRTRPFEAPTLDELYEKIKDEEPQSPRSLNPSIPKDLEAIILTALDKDQARRYASAEALADDLRRFSRLEPVLARPAGRLVKTVRWVQRNRTLSAAALLVFIALVTTTVVFFVKERDAQRALADRTKALREKNEALESEQAARAAEQAALEEKTKALDDYDRLADVKRLEAARAASDELYPPSPDLVPRLLAWQEEHGSLAQRLAGHESFLGELREKAEPYTDAERRRDFAKELTEITKLEASQTQLDEDVVEAGEDEEKRKPLLERREQMAKRLAELEELTTSGRRSWRFADQALQFQHDVLAELIDDIRKFVEDEQGPLKSIAARLEKSRAIARETLEGEVASRWTACRERITKSEIYKGLDLDPQLGLIPLGPDPDSKLEEFLHWLTHEGDLPGRYPATGKIAVTEKLGVILVLIPRGTFLMGSQNDAPDRPNFDPNLRSNERPVHSVNLDAYFLSKYEMTQAQWRRCFGSNPSQYMPGMGEGDSRLGAPVNALHPVEMLSWTDVQVALARIDLLLPTGAEWERAARAGTSDQIFAGTSEIAELRHHANLLGAETKAIGWSGQQPGHDDGWCLHAPVGSFAANAFGLHDMTGNVWEWCFEGGSASYARQPSLRGLHEDPGASITRVCRGGSFNDPAVIVARVAFRDRQTPVYRSGNVGLRPARLIR